MRATVLSRDVFVPSPGPGVAVHAASYYTRADGGDLVCQHGHMSRSDTCDVAYRRRSRDNGRTWSEPQTIITGEKRPEGMLRRHLRCSFVDPGTGRFISFWTEGILPTDHPLEGMKHWHLRYSVSEDGGESDIASRQIIQSGPEFDARHPLPGVVEGKTCIMLGDLGSAPLSLPDGSILLPAQASPPGPDGHYVNPGKGFTFTDAMILRARWREDKEDKNDKSLQWESSTRIPGDPARSTRGWIEPTLGLLGNGRLLMILRGSNDAMPSLAGYRWQSISNDDGQTWTDPAPWRFTDGQVFHSPSSCSQLLAHSSGRLLWLGNICPNNPRGNSPRYPLVLAEVDPETGLLIRDSVCAIDDRGPTDQEGLTLSNFISRENRETGHLLLHLTRLFAHQKADWTADAMLYRIDIG